MIDVREVFDSCTGLQALEVPLRGRALLDCALLNKGSAFSAAERAEFGLVGLLPWHISTLDEQVARRFRDFRQKETALERHLFLRAVQDRNETLFYRLLQDHIAEMLPVVYTPEVGEICQRYSQVYHQPRGLYLSYPQRHEMEAMLASRPYRRVEVIVVTDGERILGLGDQGLGGMGIPVGKLALYTLCGGIPPARTLPVLLDVGTDNPERLRDPDYLGWRHERMRGPDYDEFIEGFVQAVTRQLPGVLLQWEDFAQANARRLLDRYRNRLCTFNDDIQGTGAVALAALLTAARLTRGRLSEQRIVVVGAGSAGTGICDLLAAALKEEGLSQEEVCAPLWLMSSRGLLHTGSQNVTPGQTRYCQPAARVTDWQRDAAGNIPLFEVVNRVRPTALIGVCGQPGIFSEDVVRAMAGHVARPIIFPLSNPTSRSEAVPGDLLAWTEGRALIATGSPFGTVTFQGRSLPISQCNNVYVFPGLGLGVIALGATRVTEEMFLAAARALSDCVCAPRATSRPNEEDEGAYLLPPLEDIRLVSRKVALAVGKESQRQGLSRAMSDAEWQSTLDARCWEPRYHPLRYKP